VEQVLTALINILTETTTTCLPLPLSRWRGRGQVFEVHTDQLRATVEEASALLHEVMSITLEHGMLQEVMVRTEGWLVGLQLLAFALRGRGSLASVLEELERTNAFVVPLDHQRRWYRYHILFAEALRARLEQVNGEEVCTLHLLASRWYEPQGHTAAAMQHALSAQAWQRAADLIESITQAPAGKTCEVPTIVHWLEQLPSEIVHTRPQLCQLSATVLMQEPTQYQEMVRAVFPQGGGSSEGHQSSSGRAGSELLLLDPLSEREQKVLSLVAQGDSNQEIATALVLSVETVKRHMGNILSKLQARNRTQAVAQARTLGLLADEPEVGSVFHGGVTIELKRVRYAHRAPGNTLCLLGSERGGSQGETLVKGHADEIAYAQ
jgi:ATP/maltotriose-dependent transcriptional regulator MalT